MESAVGLIGVGRIGLPVCANLVTAGYTVIAADIRPDRETDVKAVGGAWASDPASLAEACEVLITVLPGSAELRQATGIAFPALQPGSTWIDMTSASPRIGELLRQPLLARGIDCLDAPAGGGIPAAEAGTCQLFVGGPVATVERHRALLEALGQINHVGGHGAGYTTKLVVNLLWFSHAIAAGEALLLAGRTGIDLDVLRDALQRSAAQSEFIRRDLDGLLDGDYLRSFGLDRCVEELDALNDLARELGTPFELSSTIRRLYAQALEHFGPVDGELLAVALLEQQAGLRLRRARRSPPSAGD